MNQAFVLESEGPPAVRLRSIGSSDLERLRLWKNANKAAFFFKGEITPDMQRQWFQGYLGRADDFMFVVEAEGRLCGCLGFRMEGADADAYNIMAAAEPGARVPGAMTQAMRALCSFILAEKRPSSIGCKVVRGNAALDYYRRCGYAVADEKPDFYQLRLSPEFQGIPYAKRSLR